MQDWMTETDHYNIRNKTILLQSPSKEALFKKVDLERT